MSGSESHFSTATDGPAMRILRVAQKVYPDVKGGAPYHVHAMSRDQAAMGHDVTVLTVRYDESLPHVEERDGYTLVRYDPALTLLGNDISPGLGQYLSNAEDFDVIHAHSHLYFATNLVAFKRLFEELPLAITNHGLYSQTASRRVQEIYLRSAGRWTLDRANTIFCYTAAEKDRVQALGVDSAIEVISNGIDQSRFRPDGPTSELVDSDGPVVLDVARLVEGKRPEDVIKAVERLRDDYPKMKLYLCGDGPLRPHLENQIAKANLEGSVVLLGNVDYDVMPQLYRSCDVLVLPSEEEAGCPRVVLEAMATKKPFVIADKPQTSRELKRLGETFPIGDTEELAERIDEILSSPDLQTEMGTDGRELVEREFNWAKTVRETTSAVEQMRPQQPTAPY